MGTNLGLIPSPHHHPPPSLSPKKTKTNFHIKSFLNWARISFLFLKKSIARNALQSDRCFVYLTALLLSMVINGYVYFKYYLENYLCSSGRGYCNYIKLCYVNLGKFETNFRQLWDSR